MAEPHVITALIDKRAELAGKIEAVQTQLRQLVIDLDNVDHVLRLYDPDIELAEIVPKPMPQLFADREEEVGDVGQTQNARTGSIEVIAYRGRHIADVQNLVDKPRRDSAFRHAVVLGGLGLLHQGEASGFLDRP